MRSNRRQDFQGAQWQLGEVFPKFLEQAPVHAVRSLLSVLASYVAREHSHGSSQPEESTFDLDSRTARFVPDFSYVWDQGHAYRHDDELKMLDIFENGSTDF